MKAVYFDGCFGWLHAAPGRHGVVLCNPFGYEAYCAHRGWRRLAEAIAAAGLPALRFDYPGTGDSAGVEEDPQRFDAWLASIEAAIRWMKKEAGVERVSLVGLRVGGALAALAAERVGGVDGLALLAPVVRGRSYVRELRALRRKWLNTSGHADGKHGDDPVSIDVFGFGLHGGDVERLHAVDLCADTHRPARRVLILDSTDPARSQALAVHFAAYGATVEEGRFDEYDRFVAEPLKNVLPTAAIACVTNWLAAARMTGTTAGAPPRARATLALPQATEEPVCFDRCFGIYCVPDQPIPGAPAVLITNTSAGHHIGDARLSVLLARRLAARGIASLRMDIGGVGDAVLSGDDVTAATVFSEHAVRDASAGADWLATQGHARLVAFGVCSGAYVALHVCARHAAVVGAYGINLPMFVWQAGKRPAFGTLGQYARSALNAHKWVGAMQGDTHPLEVARELSRRVARHAALKTVRGVEKVSGRKLLDTDEHRLIRTLANKRACVKLVYGETDVGVAEARAHFGLDFAGLAAFPSIRAVVIPGIDHALFERQARLVSMMDFERWLYGNLLGTMKRDSIARWIVECANGTARA